MDPEVQQQVGYFDGASELQLQQSESSQQFEQYYKHKENNPDYKGEQIDRNLINGPKNSHYCTNLICFIVFCLFAAGMIFMGIVGYSKGDIFSLGVPQDSYGNRCGYDDKFTPYFYAYYPDPNDLDQYICVMDCPKNDKEEIPNLAKYYQENTGLSNIQAYESFQEGRTCIPKKYYSKAKLIEDLKLPENLIEQHMGDLRAAWPMLIGGIFLITFFGYIYIFFMKQFAAKMTWLCIILYFIFLIVGGGLFYSEAQQLGPYQDEKISASQKEQNMIIAVVFWVIAALSLIYLCMNWKKINYAITILICSVDYAKDYPKIFFLPLIIQLGYTLFLIYWILTALSIYSSGEDIKEDKQQGPYKYRNFDSNMQGFFFLFVIFYFWVSEYTIAYTQYVIASSASKWYFYKDQQGIKKNMPGNIITSMISGFMHSGTLMLGSAITGIFAVINLIFVIFYKCTKQERNRRHQQLISGQQPVEKCGCCVGVSNFYQAYLRYITKSAYVQTAITGNAFGKASHDSFYLMKRNDYYFSAMNGIGSLMIFIGKIFILGITTFISYFAILNAPQIKDYSYSPALPTLFIAFSSYYIGAIYVSVYGTAADAILQCFCIEEELYSELREEEQGRYFRQIPSTLQQFLEKNNLGGRGKKYKTNNKK